MQPKHNFRIKYDSADNSIDSLVYARSLISLSDIVKESNHFLQSGQSIKVEIVAQDKGSFDALLQLTDAGLENFFTKENANLLMTLVQVLIGLVGLKLAFRNADVTKTEVNNDEVSIKNQNGEVIYVTNKNTYNIFTQNQVVQDSLAEQFRVISEDEKITGVEIRDVKTSEHVRVEREEFQDLAKPIELDQADQEQNVVSASLTIIKIVLDGNNRKWEFILNGNKISAPILDKEFTAEVKSGARSFANGDQLIVDLRITRTYDEALGVFLNTGLYEVLKVREHKSRTERQQLKLE